MRDLSSLIERVEKLEGASPDMDRLIWRATCWEKHYGEVPINTPFTGSLDAAVALAERLLPGWARGFDAGPKTNIAFVDPHDYADRLFAARYTAEAPTPAIALVLAILKALQEGEG